MRKYKSNASYLSLCIDGAPVRGASWRRERGTHDLPSLGNLMMMARLYCYLSGIIRQQV
jgi:hypothetical protein